MCQELFSSTLSFLDKRDMCALNVRVGDLKKNQLRPDHRSQPNQYHAERLEANQYARGS